MTEVLSTVRDGRFVRSERLEGEGRVQSWVLAGEHGAAEVRGTASDWLYALVHRPAAKGEFTGEHSLLLLVDATVWPEDRCPVLEGPCVPHLVTPAGGSFVEAANVWRLLHALYDVFLDKR